MQSQQENELDITVQQVVDNFPDHIGLRSFGQQGLYDYLYPSGQRFLEDDIEENMADVLMNAEAEKSNSSEPPKKRKRKGKKEKEEDPRRTQECCVCHKKYMHKGHLQRHIVTQHRFCAKVHQFNCSFCGAIFADDASFDQHKADVEEEMIKYFEKFQVSEANQQELIGLLKKYKGQEFKVKVEVREQEEENV